MSLSRRWVPVCVLILSTAAMPAKGSGVAGGAAAGAEALEGIPLLQWTGEQLAGSLAGEVGGVVFSGLLSGFGLGGDPNQPVLDELKVVEAQLDQISNQLNLFENKLQSGLEDLDCHVEGNQYVNVMSSSRDDREAIKRNAESLLRLSQKDQVPEAQEDIRTAFAGDVHMVEIHHRVNDFASVAVQAFNDRMRACSFFIDNDRLDKIKAQFAWVASLQVASCQMVINYYFDRAKTAGMADPTQDGDYRAAVRDCQEYTGTDLRGMAITSNLPDGQTVYELAASEIDTNLLWKWADFAHGRKSCYGDFNDNGQPFHKAIPTDIAEGDCHDFQGPDYVCEHFEGPIYCHHDIKLQVQIFGDATTNLQTVGGDWLLPRESDLQRFIGTCKNMGDHGTKDCLAAKGWTDSNHVVIGGEGGGFYFWVLPDRWNPTRSRTTNANFLWVVTNTAGPAGPTDHTEYSAGVMVVKKKADADRFILDEASP